MTVVIYCTGTELKSKSDKTAGVLHRCDGVHRCTAVPRILHAYVKLNNLFQFQCNV